MSRIVSHVQQAFIAHRTELFSRLSFVHLDFTVQPEVLSPLLFLVQLDIIVEASMWNPKVVKMERISKTLVKARALTVHLDSFVLIIQLSLLFVRLDIIAHRPHQLQNHVQLEHTGLSRVVRVLPNAHCVLRVNSAHLKLALLVIVVQDFGAFKATSFRTLQRIPT